MGANCLAKLSTVEEPLTWVHISALLLTHLIEQSSLNLTNRGRTNAKTVEHSVGVTTNFVGLG